MRKSQHLQKMALMDKYENNRDLILLNTGYAELDNTWNWPNVYSPFARLYYIESGKAQMQFGEDIYILEGGYLYLIPPFTLHDDRCEDEFVSYYMHFYEKNLNRESFFDKYQLPIKIEANELDISLIKRVIEINPNRQLINYDPIAYDNPPTFLKNIADNRKAAIHVKMETHGIITQLLSKFLSTATMKASHLDERIDKALQYIHSNIDKNISLAELSDIACVSEDHFIRLFRQAMNSTPMKYIIKKKIEKAQILLLTTEGVIRDIALDLAFDNVSYFNRMFKQHTGKTPKEYRTAYQ